MCTRKLRAATLQVAAASDVFATCVYARKTLFRWILVERSGDVVTGLRELNFLRRLDMTSLIDVTAECQYMSLSKTAASAVYISQSKK